MKIKLASVLCFVLPVAANFAAVRAEEQSQDPPAAVQPQVLSIVGTWTKFEEGGWFKSFRTFRTFKADGTYTRKFAAQYYAYADFEEGTYTYADGLLTTSRKTFTSPGYTNNMMNEEPVKTVVTWLDDDHIRMDGNVFSRWVPKAE